MNLDHQMTFSIGYLYHLFLFSFCLDFVDLLDWIAYTLLAIYFVIFSNFDCSDLLTKGFLDYCAKDYLAYYVEFRFIIISFGYLNSVIDLLLIVILIFRSLALFFYVLNIFHHLMIKFYRSLKNYYFIFWYWYRSLSYFRLIILQFTEALFN